MFARAAAAAATVLTPVCRLLSEALPPEACLPTRLVELHLDSLKDSLKQLTGLQVRLLHGHCCQGAGPTVGGCQAKQELFGVYRFGLFRVVQSSVLCCALPSFPVAVHTHHHRTPPRASCRPHINSLLVLPCSVCPAAAVPDPSAGGAAGCAPLSPGAPQHPHQPGPHKCKHTVPATGWRRSQVGGRPAASPRPRPGALPGTDRDLPPAVCGAVGARGCAGPPRNSAGRAVQAPDQAAAAGLQGAHGGQLANPGSLPVPEVGSAVMRTAETQCMARFCNLTLQRS